MWGEMKGRTFNESQIYSIKYHENTSIMGVGVSKGHIRFVHRWMTLVSARIYSDESNMTQ